MTSSSETQAGIDSSIGCGAVGRLLAALAPWRLSLPSGCLLLAYSADFDLLATDEDGLTFFGDPFGPTPDYFRFFLAKPSHRLKLLTVLCGCPCPELLASDWRGGGGRLLSTASILWKNLVKLVVERM